MLMWLTGFLVVPTAREWSGAPFLVLAVGLLALWFHAFGPSPIEIQQRQRLQRWVQGLAAEEAVVGGITGPLAGVHLAWNLAIGMSLPSWAPWIALGTGVCSLALAQLRQFRGEWLFPVRGRWRALSLAAAGTLCLHLAGPCWIFLFQLWRSDEFGANGPLLLTARIATVLLTGVALLYSTAFVLRFGRRDEGAAMLDVEHSLTPQVP